MKATPDLRPSTVTVLVGPTRVRIRPILPTDTAALQVMHHGLSEATVYRRFFAALPELALEQAERFTHVDGLRRAALVAEGPEGELVGVGRYDVLDDEGRTAEVAFVVADAFQHQGLGTTLVRLVASLARAAGIEVLVADVLTNNTAMHHAFRDAGLTAQASYDAGIAHLEMPLA